MRENVQKTVQENIQEEPVNEVVQLMAHFMNYLSVSLYESEFTKNHEDSYADLNTIYDNVSLQSSNPPSLSDCVQFYDNIVYLGKVTYTDDPDYYNYKMRMRKYIADLRKQLLAQSNIN